MPTASYVSTALEGARGMEGLKTASGEAFLKNASPFCGVSLEH